VTAERDGTSIYYSLNDPRILEAMELLRNVVADLLDERARAVGKT
jgi:DNA-binding transcriptional ArsR family regulator